MKYVLDSSVAVKWVIAEADTPKAVGRRSAFLAGVDELLAPDFFPLEIAHALMRAERQGRIVHPQGGALWRDVMVTCPRLFPSTPLVPRAYQIASRARIGIYDSLFVALADREQCQLVTADDKLVKNVQALFPFVVLLSSLP